MKTKLQINPVYMFPDGARIDLRKLIYVGPIDKHATGIIFINLICEGINKPIELGLGYAIGTTPDHVKLNIEMKYRQFVSEWEAFVRQKAGIG